MTGKHFEADNVLREEEESDQFTLEEIREQFKVFKDPTFQEFVQIVGTKFNEDLPLFA